MADKKASASSNTLEFDFKGTTYRFLRDPPHDLLCIICLCLVDNPQQVTCCGKPFCMSCIDQTLIQACGCNNYRNAWGETSCPHCKVKWELRKLPLFKDRRRENIIGRLPVYCPNKEKGCVAVLSLQSVEVHLRDTCAHETVPCKFKDLGCTKEVFKKDQKVHLDLSDHLKQHEAILRLLCAKAEAMRFENSILESQERELLLKTSSPSKETTKVDKFQRAVVVFPYVSCIARWRLARSSNRMDGFEVHLSGNAENNHVIITAYEQPGVSGLVKCGVMNNSNIVDQLYSSFSIPQNSGAYMIFSKSSQIFNKTVDDVLTLKIEILSYCRIQTIV